MPKRRLEAEAIRDAMLFVSGEFDLQRPGGSHVATIIGDRPISLIGLDKKLPPDLDGSMYRSVYLPVIRDRLPDVLNLFDFAEPSLVTGKSGNDECSCSGVVPDEQFICAAACQTACRATAGGKRQATKNSCNGYSSCVSRASPMPSR